jgi:hypothetical protein
MFRLRVRYEELRLYGKELVEDAKADALEIADDIIEEVGAYPPPPSFSYKRTGELGRGWRKSRPYRRWNVIGVDITNVMWYAGLVVGDEQWELHARHGWRNINDVTPKYEALFAKNVYTNFNKRWWGLG